MAAPLQLVNTCAPSAPSSVTARSSSAVAAFGVRDWQRSGEPDETLRIAPHQIGHAVVRQPRQVYRLLARSHLLDGRQTQRQHLHVAVHGIHRAEPRIHIPHGREIRARSQATQEIQRGAARYRAEALQAVHGNNVWKRVDDAHASQAPVTSR